MRLRRNNSPRGTAGLDIDGRFVAAVEAAGHEVRRTVSAELPEGLIRNGEVTDVDGLAGVLRDFVADAQLPKTVRTGVANQQIAMRVIELPMIEEKDDLEAAVRFQAAEAIAMPLDEAVLDYQVVGSVEGYDGASRLRVVLVAARRSMIDGFLGAVRGAGLKPEGIDLDAFAVVRMLADEVPEAPGVPSSSRAFCHLGGVANLAVASGRTCLFARALSTPWEVEGAASELASEMRLSIDSYTASASSVPVSDLVLSGPGSHDEDFVAELETHLAIPTSVAPPLGHLQTSDLDAGEDPSRFTVAAGLALGAAA